eukprot:2374332-Alexandrium_andersonii.AAC.1
MDVDEPRLVGVPAGLFDPLQPRIQSLCRLTFDLDLQGRSPGAFEEGLGQGRWGVVWPSEDVPALYGVVADD